MDFVWEFYLQTELSVNWFLGFLGEETQRLQTQLLIPFLIYVFFLLFV